MVVVKKYRNRRLYDTGLSRYVTLDELAERIRQGVDVRVVDAGSGADLTQATLAQIILESRGGARLLPAPLLTRLVRLGDDALADFFSRYVSLALDLYLGARQGAQAMAPWNPLATMPFAAVQALGRFFPGAGGPEPPPYAPPPPEPATPSEPPPAPREDEIAALRRELEEIKRSMKQG